MTVISPEWETTCLPSFTLKLLGQREDVELRSRIANPYRILRTAVLPRNLKDGLSYVLQFRASDTDEIVKREPVASE
jgi:hypothetical protein